MKERCDKCKFWVHGPLELLDDTAVHPDDLEGICHRYPPQLDISDLEAFRRAANLSGDYDVHTYTDHRMWNWPVTCGEGWCGEFRVP